jgi:hypothetical protein
MLFEVTVNAIRRQLDGPIAKALLGCPYGILVWRHQLTAFVTPVIRRIGGDCDVEDFNADPIRLFRSLLDRRDRFIGRILYPFG